MELFNEREEALCGSIAADLISYFGYSAELMDATASNTGPSEPADPPSLLVAFNHDPLDLLAQLREGASNLEALVFSLPARPCDALLVLQDGDVSLQVRS